MFYKAIVLANVQRCVAVATAANTRNVPQLATKENAVVLVLLYMFINIVLSRMLERYRLRVGYVSHAVLFSVTFVLLLLCSDDGFIAEAMTNMLGARVYSLIVSLVLSDTIVWLLAVIETVLFVQIFIVAFMATRCVVRRLLADNRPVGNNHAPRSQLVKGGGTPSCEHSRKLFQLYGVIRC